MTAILAGDTLDNNAPGGALGEANAVTGPDISYAFMWNIQLSSGGSLLISKDKNVVTPVPTTLLLFGSGLFSLIGVWIRRRKS